MASLWVPSLPTTARLINPSAFSRRAPASLPPSLRLSRCQTASIPVVKAVAGTDFQHARVVYPRPSEVAWSKELANTVQLIGVVGSPIQIKHLSSGKVLAWTRLAVKKSATDTLWISLSLWDELAHIAFQHLEKGDQIYVSGRLVSDVVEKEAEKPQTYYKVVVQQLNFVERSMPVSSFDPDSSATSSGFKKVNGHSDQLRSAEELWQAFFANPIEWWDNRKNKRSPNYPDFKHKHTGEALWIDARYNPPWIKSQLAVLDSRMEAFYANEINTSPIYLSGDDFAPF